MLHIDKLLKRKGWQDRLDDPFAESEPALDELWKAALDGCWRPPRRFLSRGGRSTAAVKARDLPSPTTRVSKPSTGRTQHTPRKLRRRNFLPNPRFQHPSSPPIPDQPPTSRVSDPGPAGVAARLSVATAGSKSPRFPTWPPSTGGRSATGRR